MPARKHAEKKSRSKDAYPRPAEVHEDSRTQRARQRGQEEASEIAKEMDDILDEIDGVLEQNAQAFVEAYKQVGGQ